jgi:hypothetical protein
MGRDVASRIKLWNVGLSTQHWNQPQAYIRWPDSLAAKREKKIYQLVCFRIEGRSLRGPSTFPFGDSPADHLMHRLRKGCARFVDRHAEEAQGIFR